MEPFFYHGGRYPLWEVSNKYGLEDVVLVTETGCEILTPESIIGRDMWVAWLLARWIAGTAPAGF